ncbi:MAG: hypothetical protein ABIW02_03315 [Nitrosospira sp.]
MADFPVWLFDECYQAVGDLAEPIAHILPKPRYESNIGLAAWIEERAIPLRNKAPEMIRTALFTYWNELDTQGRFLLTKLISGGFRVGVSRLLVIRALSEIAGVDKKITAQRMMGWTDGAAQPNAERYHQLIAAQSEFEQTMRAGDNREDRRKLAPFAKAYSGLTDREIAQVDAVIRKTTIEKFGSVRSVMPTMVFEIGFEGIARSTRHKACFIGYRLTKKVGDLTGYEPPSYALSPIHTRRPIQHVRDPSCPQVFE